MHLSERPPRILILAGEVSGDDHGARVVDATRAIRPEIEWVGTGGARLAAAGVEIWAGLDRLAVMGFAEVVRDLGFFRALERRVVAALDARCVDLVLLVDYPGFNLRIARRARERGIPVLYYIAPQVWAWKPHRARRLARDADRIAVILPFEAPIFEAEGGDVEFVGHPLVEAPRRGGVAGLPSDASGPAGSVSTPLRADLGVGEETPLLALLPGSRVHEVERHLPPFVEAARRAVRSHPGLVPVIGVAPGIETGRFAGTGLRTTPRVRELLDTARAALVKSGTSTLEATIAGVPLVTAWRSSPLTWWLARRLVRVEHVALPNLILDRRVVPELLQSEVTGERLAAALDPLLSGGREREAIVGGLAEVRAKLGGPGAARRVATIALELLEKVELRGRRGER
ncbi:MAG: lipid-A-disaccharide synthase [Longimicrobiales bacterium]|nr:lipid-A-disaccharide synthase [Longimicrobiales bacterium]